MCSLCPQCIMASKSGLPEATAWPCNRQGCIWSPLRRPAHTRPPPAALPPPRSDISTKAKRCKFCCAPVQPLPPSKSEKQLQANEKQLQATGEGCQQQHGCESGGEGRAVLHRL